MPYVRIFFFVKTYFTTFLLLFWGVVPPITRRKAQSSKFNQQSEEIFVYTTKHTYLSISLGAQMREILFY